MKFVALFEQNGTGCDYTIACGRTYSIVEADSEEEAVNFCKQYWEATGGSADVGLADIRLFAVSAEIEIPLEEWNEEDIAARARAEDAERIRQLEQEIGQLKKKMEKVYIGERKGRR